MFAFRRRRSRGGIAPDEKQSYRDGGSNHGDIDPGAIFRTASAWEMDIFGALDSFRSELEGPGDNECDWESDRDQRDDQAHHPIWNLQERENLRGNLD